MRDKSLGADDLKSRLASVSGADGDVDVLNALYDEWAASYDRDLWRSGNPVRAAVAAVVARLVRSEDARILDCACGTGIVGELLRLAGYRQIDGFDPSAGMRAAAEAKGVYRELRAGAFAASPGPPAGAYDAVVACGVLTQGHAGPDALEAMLRFARPGGVIVFSMSSVAYEDGGFRRKISALIERGAWRERYRSEAFRAYPFEPEASSRRLWVCAFDKTL